MSRRPRCFWSATPPGTSRGTSSWWTAAWPCRPDCTSKEEETFMAESIHDRVRAIIAEQLGVKIEEVTDTASFVEDLGADSLDTVELVMALEEEFGIEIPDEDAEKMVTVEDAIKYIEQKASN